MNSLYPPPTAQEMDGIRPWIEKNAPVIHPAWAFQKATEDKRCAPAPPKEVEERKNRFRKAMEAFFARSPDREAQNIFERTTTWEEVRAEAQKAVDQRFQGRASRNPFRKCIRATADVASRLEFLTNLIPSGDYMGVLCGGLKLIYNAANRMTTIRDLVLNSMESLSYQIEHPATYISIYSGNQILMQRVHELYVSILDAVETITEWIEKSKGVRGSLREGGKALVQGDKYGKKLEDSVTTTVREKSSAFEDAVRTCLSIEVHDIGLKVDRIYDMMTSSESDEAKLICSNVSKDKLENILRDCFSPLIKQVTDQMTQRFDPFIILPQLQPEPILPAVNLYQLLAALNLAHAPGNSNLEEQLIDIIGAERNFVSFFGGSLGEGVQRRISAVIQDSRFQNWLQSMVSQTLVVSGMDLDPLQADTASPLSYMCTLLIKSVSSVPFIYPIAFFCRLHMDPNDDLTGAGGIMRSLIGQLALFLSESGCLDLSLVTGDILQYTAMQDPAALCYLFENLLKPLRAGVVLCMIDGTDFFDNGFNLPGMNIVMPFLNSLVEAIQFCNTGLVFKLLITSHMGGGYMPEWFPNRVDLPMTEDSLLDGVDVADLGQFVGF